MGTITQLATTGTYTHDTTNGLKVALEFEVNNDSNKLNRITNGRILENEQIVCSFNYDFNGISIWNVAPEKLSETSHIKTAIDDLEKKIAAGQATSLKME